MCYSTRSGAGPMKENTNPILFCYILELPIDGIEPRVSVKIASANNSRMCGENMGYMTSETPQVPLGIENTIDCGNSYCEASK